MPADLAARQLLRSLEAWRADNADLIARVDVADAIDRLCEYVTAAGEETEAGVPQGHKVLTGRDKQKATRKSNKAIHEIARWVLTYENFAPDDDAVGAALPHVQKAVKAARVARPEAGVKKDPCFIAP
jgi:hypothetical protein